MARLFPAFAAPTRPLDAAWERAALLGASRTSAREATACRFAYYVAPRGKSRRGNSGFTVPWKAPPHSISSIHCASQGKRVLSVKIQKRLDERSYSSLLTERELEVLHFVKKGFSNHEIGDLLRISPHTAKSHVAALLKKLEATDRAEAVSRGFERGLLKL